MSKQTVESEKDILSTLSKRLEKKIEAYLTDEYGRDAEDVAEELTDVLGLDDVEELPTFSVEIVLHMGGQAFIASGLSEDKEDDEDYEDDE